MYPFEIWDMYKHSDVQGVGALFVALFFEKIKKSQKNHKNGLCNHVQITLRSYIYMCCLLGLIVECMAPLNFKRIHYQKRVDKILLR